MRRGAGVDDGDDDDSWGVISNTDQERVSFERVDMAIFNADYGNESELLDTYA